MVNRSFPSRVGRRLSRKGLPWAEDVELLTLTKCSAVPHIVKEAVEGGDVVVDEIVSERHFNRGDFSAQESTTPHTRHQWLLYPWSVQNLVEVSGVGVGSAAERSAPTITCFPASGNALQFWTSVCRQMNAPPTTTDVAAQGTPYAPRPAVVTPWAKILKLLHWHVS